MLLSLFQILAELLFKDLLSRFHNHSYLRLEHELCRGGIFDLIHCSISMFGANGLVRWLALSLRAPLCVAVGAVNSVLYCCGRWAACVLWKKWQDWELCVSCRNFIKK